MKKLEPWLEVAFDAFGGAALIYFLIHFILIKWWGGFYVYETNTVVWTVEVLMLLGFLWLFFNRIRGDLRRGKD